MDHNISLPDDLFDWAVAHAAELGFPDVDAFVLSLIEQEREAVESASVLQVLLDEGEASGECEEDAFEVLHRIIRQGRVASGQAAAA